MTNYISYLIECCCCVMLLNFDLSKTVHLFCSLPLVRECILAYYSAENENKAASLSRGCGAIVHDGYEFLAKDDIVDSSHSLH